MLGRCGPDRAEPIGGATIGGATAARVNPADAVLIGVFAFVVSVVGVGRPSLWVDESATLAASSRPLPELWALVRHVDAVHALYYLMMHGWSLLTPPGEAWLRLPSALLVGAAAAGVVVLGRQLSGRSVSVAAGVVFALLPRTTWAGVEARPYALTMACAVWLTVLLVAAVRGRGNRLWVAYGLALVFSTVANVVVVLLLAAHAVVVVGMAPARRTVIAWIAATAAAVLAVVPLMIMLLPQQAQVGWIWPIGAVTAGQIFAEQYFPSVYSDSVRAVGPDQRQFTAEQLTVALQAWARVAPVISVVVILAVLAVWKRHRRTAAIGPGSRLLVVMSAAWIVLPTAVLVGYSLVVRPIYQPHYLAFTTPAAALLIGLCVVAVGRDGWRVGALLAVIGVAALPNHLAQRSPFAKYGSDYSQVAELLATRASPGDCLMIDGAMSASAADGIAGARLQHSDGLLDVGLEHDAVHDDSLFGSRLPIEDQRNAVRSCSVVWVVTDFNRDLPELGFRIAHRWQFNQSQVVEAVRPE
jgi:mannosyltransferase